MLFVLWLFYKIVVSCITKCVTEPPMKISNLKQLIKYIVLYMINDCNSVTLDTGRYHKSEFFLDHNRLRQVGPESFDYY